jgi:hypothetical protein
MRIYINYLEDTMKALSTILCVLITLFIIACGNTPNAFEEVQYVPETNEYPEYAYGYYYENDVTEYYYEEEEYVYGYEDYEYYEEYVTEENGEDTEYEEE